MMALIGPAVLAAAGFVLLTAGGDRLILGASGLAARIGMSPLTAGILIVGFGTSAPEIILSFQAALAGKHGIAHANIIGSNIANIWLILAIPAFFSPLAVRAPGLFGSMTAMFLASLAWVTVTFFFGLNPIIGVLAIIILALYLTFLCRQEHVADSPIKSASTGIPLLVAQTGIALVFLPLGAHLLILGASRIAALLGISNEIIGLTLVAFGTSLPELAATISAARHRKTGLVLGNIVGSNLFNILGAGGAVALTGAMRLSPDLQGYSNPAMILASLCLFVLIACGWRIGKGIGLFFAAAYGLYLTGLVNGWSLA